MSLSSTLLFLLCLSWLFHTNAQSKNKVGKAKTTALSIYKPNDRPTPAYQPAVLNPGAIYQPCKNQDKVKELGCKNGGSCVESIGPAGQVVYSCHCLPGWTGTKCTSKKNPCSALKNPCQHGATCVTKKPKVPITGIPSHVMAIWKYLRHSCICALSFWGLNCENINTTTLDH